MTDQHGGIAQFHKPHKKQHDGDTGNNIRIQHGNVGDRTDHCLASFAHHRHTDTGKSSQQSGNQCRRCSQHQRCFHCVDHCLILKQLHIPVQRKAAPYGTGLGSIKGTHDQYRNGRIQNREDQSHIKFLEKGFCFYHIICPSPDLSYLFIMAILIKMKIISTMERPEPRCQLFVRENS